MDLYDIGIMTAVRTLELSRQRIVPCIQLEMMELTMDGLAWFLHT